MRVLNYTLIAVVLLLVGFSAYSIVAPYLMKSTFVAVDSIKSGVDCGSLEAGDRIVSVESNIIKSAADFLSAVSTVKSGDDVSMIANNAPVNCRVIGDGDLGFTVKEVSSGGLKFGPDIAPTKSYTYSLENSNSTTLAKARKILTERMNFYDFAQSRVDVVGDKIKIVTAFDDELYDIIRPGRLRATVFESFKLEQGAAKVIVGNVAYILRPKNETISINGTDFPVAKPFELANATFHFVNVSGPSINLEAELYGNDDVLVNPDSHVIVNLDQESGMYFYYIQVSVAPDVNEKLTNIIKKAESVFVPGGGSVLNAKLNYYVDEQMVSSLTIPVDLVGNQINAISGVEKTSDEAYKIGRIVYTSLRFGPLPSELKLESQSVSEPSINKSVSYGTLGIGAVAMLGILGFMFARIKKPKVVFWTFVIVVLGLFISVGLLVAATKYLSVNTLVDFPVLVGISLLSIYSTLTFFVYFEGLEGRHKHIIIGYKKIISLMNFLRILLLGAIIVGIIGYRGMAFVLLVGLLLDILLMKQLFKTLTTSKI